jgi:hypothetical protein
LLEKIQNCLADIAKAQLEMNYSSPIKKQWFLGVLVINLI